MQIRSLALNGYMTHAAFNAELPPLALICGPNEAGKSSIAESIEFCFLGSPGRVEAKKNLPELLTDGHAHGAVKMALDGLLLLDRDIATGKLRGPEPELPAALPYCLRGQRFAALDAAGRRAFLYGLMGVKTGPEEWVQRLLARNCEKDAVATVTPLLRGGSTPALAEAEKRRIEAKGQWREVTGEIYGDKKAVSWAAPAVAFDAAELEAVRKDIAGWDAEVERLTRLQERAAAITRGKQRVAELRKQAQGHAVAAERRNAARKRIKEIEAELETLPPAPGVEASRKPAGAAQTPVPALECPCCQAKLRLQAGKLVKQEEAAPVAAGVKLEPSKADLAAAERRRFLAQELQQNVDTELAATRQVNEADAASKLADEQEALPQIDGADELPGKLKEAQENRDLCRADENAFLKLRDDAASAEKRTNRAAELHHAVQKWDQLCDALGPNGVPAEIVGAVLGPLNAELAKHAEATGWEAVSITAEMEIYIGKRRYRMKSKSARWRADAQVAVSIGVISGVKLVVLDEFDLLDLPSRPGCLGWLWQLTQEKALDSAIVLGTLKSAPNMPDGAGSFWIGERAAA